MSRLAFFLAVLVPAILALTAYVARRAAQSLGASKGAQRAAVAVVWAMIALPIALRVTHGTELAQPLSILGFGVAFACFFDFALLLPHDLAHAAWDWIARRRSTNADLARALENAARSEPDTSPTPNRSDAADEPEPAEPATIDTPAATASGPLSRREVLRRTGIAASLAVGTSSSAYALTIGRHDYVLEEVSFALPRLPRTLEGYTIAQLSDVHIGAFVRGDELREAEALIRRARPDLIVLTGDLIDHDIRYAPRLGAFVRRLEQLGVRDGVVAIPGNHDYYAGIDDVLATLREGGARVLRNEGLIVPDGERASAASPRGGFSLLGTDDLWARRYGTSGGADLPRTIAAAAPDLARVLLCHNPELFAEAAGQVDLQLSGHTHGGQITFLVRPADLFLRHGFVAGRYERSGSSLYVNRGFGTVGPPARLGNPPEVTRIVLASS